ncbi:MFS transporter [Candidatus Marsarchaeota G2 archaeon ECH_B_SAG-G06]|uniref:MFS transporter n=1 Tax=Candidatus Marsarchaeota G2 archaeon ECH_B_SAG-G06 TaxID=1978166 RepID=A0A2R6C0U2_9ARCH|nr:MAG: MFS transporter [Candidatus Marsarchaeota G2 archaeon ECH_B_SAG-G06]
MAFILPIYLRGVGFSVELVGVYAFLATLSSSVLLVFSGFLGDLYSRRKTLLLVMGLPIVAYTTLIITTNKTALLLTSLAGLSLSGMGGGAGGGPVAPLLTAMVASRVKSGRERTSVYSYLTAFSTLSAVGGGFFSTYIISAFPDEYARLLFISALTLNLASSLGVWFITEEPDTCERLTGKSKSILPRKSIKNAGKIALAGSFGSVGLGMVTPLMPLYFKSIGASDLKVSLVYDATYILSAIVTLLSSRIERVLGSVKSIFILRSVGTLLLAVLPFTKSLALAAVIYVARSAAYQAALPIRQNISMGLYSAEERSRASSLTGIARRLPYGVATVFGSLLFSAGEFIGLFASAAGISFIDPLLYYMFFRNLNIDGEGAFDLKRSQNASEV